jgi:hypothetical protein
MQIELYSKLNDPLNAIDRIGQFFAKSGMFGCDRVEQGQVLAMVCLSENKSPVVINRTYDIVEGKLRKKALAALAEFRSKGGKHKWLRSGDEATEKEDDRKAVLEVTPTDAPPLTYSYSMADARAEGLIRDKSRWTKRPGNMLRARCISNALGMVCPELYAGDDDGEAEPLAERPINLAAAAQETAKAVVVDVVATHVAEATSPTPPPQQPATAVTPEPQAEATPAGTKLPQELVDQVEKSISEHAVAAGKWMLKEGWLQAGQGLDSLTEARAKRIIKNRESFIRAITEGK